MKRIFNLLGAIVACALLVRLLTASHHGIPTSLYVTQLVIYPLAAVASIIRALR